MPEKHHPLEPHLSLHPAQCHMVCGPAHHEPRGPPEQRGTFCQGDEEGTEPKGRGGHRSCIGVPEQEQEQGPTVGCYTSPHTLLIMMSRGWGVQGWCRLVTAAYNYFHVTNFFWMFGEGCYLHTAIVLTYSTDRLRKWMFICIGWGKPAGCQPALPSGQASRLGTGESRSAGMVPSLGVGQGILKVCELKLNLNP